MGLTWVLRLFLFLQAYLDSYDQMLLFCKQVISGFRLFYKTIIVIELEPPKNLNKAIILLFNYYTYIFYLSSGIVTTLSN